ncbi:hypothetical protein D9611_010274 [Ephemerocybe angulata]|uniref:Metallo-beta-lactamase domain-containing protein n=1 Tax=Ephemerocybe angulata TaxID=980116 RepID=A0A8H5F1R2_9AGAR|nr:hypothetical protein D9611_010274 [Tulosesus angulatus]
MSIVPPKLQRVSKLTITFLVDNNLEWMTKLPPGFTHELQQHIPHSRKAGTGEPGAGVPVLDFNDFCCGAHGFSALIETEPVLAIDGGDATAPGGSAEGALDPAAHYYTLFDTGPDSLSLVRNIRALQVPITKIDRVVTSHWHSDHTGGLLSFLDLRRTCVEDGVTTPPLTSAGEGDIIRAQAQSDFDSTSPREFGGVVSNCTVDVHPSRPHLRGIAPPPTWKKVLCALPPDPAFDAIEARGGIVEKRDDGHTVAGGTVWISGEVPRVTEWEKGLLGGVRWVKEGEDAWGDHATRKGDLEASSEDDVIEPAGEAGTGKWIAEPHIMDERYAVVDVEGKGLVVFSSCSHAGIVNVIRDAVKTFNRPIYMIVGGLHLASADLYPRIEPTVKFLSENLRPAPTYVLPMHCTGWKAKIALEGALGEGMVPAGVGHRVEIIGTKEVEGVDAGRMWVRIVE